jgi:hypothetical protein
MQILKNRKKAEIIRETWLCSLDAPSAGGLKE